MDESQHIRKQNWHDKIYKKLLLIPALLLLVFAAYMFIFYSANGDFIHKDISLTGGTTITIYSQIDVSKMTADLSPQLEDFQTREIYDIVTREHKAVIIETKSDGELTKSILEQYLGYELTDQNSSFEFTGSALSESFYKQLVLALGMAFVLMALVVFFLFRTFVPSTAVIVSAIADIFMTLSVVNLLGLRMSSAGIIALLLLIGYSVDTDILLTNRVLKRDEGPVNERIFGAFKTGITMTLTSIVAVGIALLIVQSFSIVLTQIFTILVIGLGFDLLNTWITNVSILKWYVEKKK